MPSSYSLKHVATPEVFILQENSSLVGRSSNCDIQIDHDSLSREHARLVQRNDDLSVQDLHSTNGTFVNERPLTTETSVHPGDVIRFGQESYSVQVAGDDATLVFDPMALANLNSASSMLVEDEEDGTMMLQSIALPAEWAQSSVKASIESELSQQDNLMIGALRTLSIKKLRHKTGLLLTILSEHKPPIVKLLSTDKQAVNWSLGRGKDVSLQLDDARVSEHHALIHKRDNVWEFEDKDSRNGSYSKHKRITTLTLESGNNISVGPYLLKFELISRN